MHAQKNPNQISLSNFPQMSENIVNTERISIQNTCFYHYEGGWPKGLDITDKNE